MKIHVTTSSEEIEKALQLPMMLAVFWELGIKGASSTSWVTGAKALPPEPHSVGKVLTAEFCDGG